MPNVTVQATTDSPTLTVAAILKDPLLLPTLILQGIDQLFVAEKVLRSAGTPSGGSVVYYESTPLFSNDASQFVEEFGEIPVTTTNLGTPKAIRTRKKGLGVRISQEMADRNSIDLVNTQIMQVRNTLIRDFDSMFINAVLNNASILTYAASTPWATSTHIRKDILNGKKLSTDKKMGFDLDTLVINPSSEIDLIGSAEIQAPYVGNVADMNPAINGNVSFGFAGVPNVLKTYAMPAGTAMMVQAKRCGFYADERPLQATPLYVEAKENETWRSDTIRTTVAGVDQPFSVVMYSGI